MKDTKTGVIICRKENPEKKIVYEAVLFILDVPDNFTDAHLEATINLENIIKDIDCLELLFRADIHSTSNEVQEQFENLRSITKPVLEVSFDKIAVNSSLKSSTEK